MENKKLQNLEKELKHVKEVNNQSPFPIFDTEHVEHVEDVINSIKKSKEDYDAEPVHACGGCGNLALKTLDEGEFTTVCLRCNSVNNIVTYDNIFEWESSKHGAIWKNI